MEFVYPFCPEWGRGFQERAGTLRRPHGAEKDLTPLYHGFRARRSAGGHFTRGYPPWRMAPSGAKQETGHQFEMWVKLSFQSHSEALHATLLVDIERALI